LENLLPLGSWKSFTLETNTVINHWDNPIIYKEIVPFNPYPQYPRPFWETPWICQGTVVQNGYQLNEGIYNIEY
jgi:hypothetical protein